MRINMMNTTPASESDIAELSSNLGINIPHSYKEFLLSYNGAKLESNTFEVTQDMDCGIDRFIPICDMIRERSNIDHINPTQIPIAWAEGGNYLLLDLHTGGIFFWDHEFPEKQYNLAPNITTFLNKTEPFDPSRTALKKGQVKRAWIDPDFLKSLS